MNFKLATMAMASLFVIVYEVQEARKPPTITPSESTSVYTKYTPEPIEIDKRKTIADRERDESASAYIQKYKQIAIIEESMYRIPRQIGMAQALLETNFGRSGLMRENNNHFGLKCFSKTCKKGHCTNFTDDSHKDFFLKFKTPFQSWRQHSLHLQSARYSNLKKCKSIESYAFWLRKDGYATDPRYAQKIISIIKKYDLDNL